MDIAAIKKELASLGAKTTGTKRQLEKRLLLCKKKNGSSFLNTRPVKIKTPIPFPSNVDFEPLASDKLKGEKIINYDCIDTFFEKNLAKKGKEKGRILAIKLFIKNTQIAKDNDKFFIRSKCCAEQKKSTDYHLEMIVKRRRSSFEILQSSCSCPAGSGYSAACNHIGALCFSLEYFSITGKVQEFVSCTSSKITLNKPSGGVDFMSIFDINKTQKKNISPCNLYTDNIINALINRKISCNLTNCRRVDNLVDHTYAHLEDSESRFVLSLAQQAQSDEFSEDSEAGPSTRF